MIFFFIFYVSHNTLIATQAVSYVSFSPLQSEVRVTVNVERKDERQHLFRVVLRFTNPTSAGVSGSIAATNNRGAAGEAASAPCISQTPHVIQSNLWLMKCNK